jgi:peroxiredoxin
VSATSARAESVEGVRAAAEQAQAEVLIYGTVTDAATLRDADGFPPTPTRKIDIELRLVETETGKTLWEATYSGSDKARTKDEYIIGESVEHVLIKTAPFWELMPRVPAETPLLAVGADAPAFEAKDIKGTSYSLDGNLKDNVVVLRFWYFSCDRCRQFLVELNGIHRRYNLSGASVIAVSLEKEPMSIQLKSRIYQDRLEYTFIADSFKSGSLETADAYMVSGKPAVYVIDRSGKIAFASAGDISAGDIGVAVASELNKK